MKIRAKASRFLELSRVSNLTTKQAKELSDLRRELSACGLDPQHPVGLENRALVHDNIGRVEAYLNTCKAKNGEDKERAAALKDIGINTDNKDELRLIVASIKQHIRAVDRKKTVKGVCLARSASDIALIEDLNAEDDDDASEEEKKQMAEIAAAELRKEEEARKKREALSRESITAFVQEAFGI